MTLASRGTALRPGEPHGHEWNEGLPAGDDPHVVAGGEHRASLVEIRGSRIFEWGGLHRTALNVLENLASFCRSATLDCITSSSGCPYSSSASSSASSSTVRGS